MCRDFYSSAGITGQLLYPRDLEIGNHIEILKKIGVTSAKIEGRLRLEAEIKNIIETIKSGQLDESYSSYIASKLPVRNMFNPLKPRIRYSK
ncbi:MAG: U32 family peptidase [Ruminococcus sp.]|nr:U32 family peptidase [Ruminococcus sp.]